MKRFELALGILVVAACGTNGGAGGGDANLPSAGVGPFRTLAPEEVKGQAPFVLEDSVAMYREPAVLREGDVTFLYAVAHVAKTNQDVIVRTRATDERTFFGSSSSSSSKPVVVLAPDRPWEGNALGGPSLVRLGGDVLLYHSGAEGIGVARSSDGRVFRKEPGPVLGRDPSRGSWETTPPRAPTVYALPDGRLRMLYAAGTGIGEASSADGVAWERLGGGPVLAPVPGDPSSFEGARVSDPCAAPRITPDGRFQVRVLYTGTNAAGRTAIGFAGRYGDAGPFERHGPPVYAVDRAEAAPALLELDELSFLYVQQELQSADKTWTAIAAAVAPDTATLPLPGAFPAEP
jgi:hypothetical protein